MTYSSLIQSDAGKALRSFKEHPDVGVRKQAKAVISHWKTSLVVSASGPERREEQEGSTSSVVRVRACTRPCSCKYLVYGYRVVFASGWRL